MESRRFQKAVILALVLLGVIYWEYSRKRTRQFLDRPVEPLIILGGNSPAELPAFDKGSLKMLMEKSQILDVEGKKVPVETFDTALAGGGRVLLNFWASWCPPCVEELPSLLKFSKTRAKELGMTVIAISFDERLDVLKREFNKFGLGKIDDVQRAGGIRIFWDGSGLFSSAFSTTKFPETFLIDSDGHVLRKFVGAQDWMDEKLLKL